jgi:hypothetical protein
MEGIQKHKSLSFQLMTMDEWKGFLKAGSYKCVKKIYYVEKFFDILSILKQFVIETKEPICFLYSEQKVLVCKIATSRKSLRGICIQEEIDALEKLKKNLHDFWKPFIQISADIGNSKIEEELDIVCSFTEYTPFHLSYNASSPRTMRDLVIKDECSDLIFRGCLFQILALLKHLQKAFPGFRHNDLKADNVLITSGPSSTLYKLDVGEGKNVQERYFKVPTYYQCVLFDFESTWWKNKFSSDDEELLKLKQNYGIFNVECTIFDFHLFCMDIIRCCKGEKDFWFHHYQHFYLFLMDFFQDWCFKKDNLIEYRLKRSNQITMKWDLNDMMLHPYFYGFRYLNEDIHDKNVLVI